MLRSFVYVLLKTIMALCLMVGSSAGLKAQSMFVLPVDEPVSLAGTFCELRTNHFHSGLDFRTGGEEGRAVCATANGWVSRVKVSAVGFGKVIYVDHADGFTSVYAHLHHFEGQLAAFVDSAQRASEQFEVELFPDSGRFLFLQGEVVALSGNTGGSEGPHLHFEIRDRISQFPLNPLAFLKVPDSIPPIIAAVKTFAKKGNKYPELDLKSFSSSTDTLFFSTAEDSVCFAMAAIDPDSSNRLGVYQVLMMESDSVCFEVKLDSLNFDESRFVNAHTTFLPDVKGAAGRMHRLFRLPGNLSASFRTFRSGIIALKDTLSHFLKIVAADYSGNRTERVICVQKNLPDSLKLVSPPAEALNDFSSSTIKYSLDSLYWCAVPKGGAYEDYILTLDNVPEQITFYAPAITITTDLEVPFHKPAKLHLPLLKKDIFPLVVERVDRKGKMMETLLPDTLADDFIEVRIRNAGTYFIRNDNLKPSIIKYEQLTDPVDHELYSSVIYHEKGAGLKKYRVTRNGEWILAELDAKSNRIRWKNDHPIIGPVYYRIFLVDACGNSEEYFFAE
jgi:Peptidase family M23